MKLLLVGFDAPWINTGFASTLKAIGKEFIKRGHEVYSISGNFVFDTDGPILHDGMVILSNKGCDLYPDKQMFMHHYKQIQPDIVLAHQDFYRIKYFSELDESILNKTLVWLPIEDTDRFHELEHLRKLKNVAFTTEYGVKLYKDLLIRSRIFQINHQVGEEFVQAEPQTIEKIEQIKDKFKILRVDRNQTRKKWDLTLKSFASFIKKYYIKDAILIAKTRPRDIASKQDLEVLVEELGIKDNVVFVGEDLNTAQLKYLYNNSDVFFSSTGSEGFGLAIAEAMVSGKPVLCPDAQPLKAVVGEGAGEFIKVKSKDWQPELYIHYNTIDIDDACDKIYKYYDDWKNGSSLIKTQGNRAKLNSKKYRVDLVVDSFENAFEEMKKTEDTVLISIATKNRPDHLVALLTSIYNQTYRNYDVYVIDNSDDERIIQSGAFLKQMTLFQSSGRNFSIYKNPEPKNAPDTHQQIFEVAKQKNIKYVLKIDDDCILEKDVLEKLMFTISSDDKIGAVSCSILEPNRPLPHYLMPINSSPQKVDDLGTQNRQWFWNTEFPKEEVEHLYSSFIYRTKAMEEVGGFPKDLSKVAFREETLTTYPMFLKGWKLILDASAVIWHMKANYGGCRDHYIEELYKSDDEKFKERLKKLKEEHNA